METGSEGRCSLWGPCRDVISRIVSESQSIKNPQLEQEFVVRQSSRQERGHGNKGHFAIRHQATTVKDIGN
jgi:hypothetical protein